MKRIVLIAAALALLLVIGVTAAVALNGTRQSQPVAVEIPPRGASVPDVTLCRDAQGVVGPCDTAACDSQQAINDRMTPPGPVVCDIDGQPRVEQYQVLGCAKNTLPDVGADEYYPPGCEPYSYGVVPATVTTTTSTTSTTTTSTTSSTTTTTPPPFSICDEFNNFLKPSTSWKQYAKANPLESARVASYLCGGPKPTVATKFGIYIVDTAEQILK